MATKQRAPKSFRLSDEGELLLAETARKLGIKQTAVIEMGIRKIAEREGVSLMGMLTQAAHQQQKQEGGEG
jgi:hypothetical protein